jgi:hypothetical protein
MTEDEREETLSNADQLDHLAKLADDRWREYESKSQAEWKLSYSVWATLLAAMGALLTRSEGVLVCRSTFMLIVITFGVFAFIVHWWFLNWVHKKLGSLRNEMNQILDRRRKLLNVDGSAQADAESGRESLRVQLCITVLLGALLIGVAYVLPT